MGGDTDDRLGGSSDALAKGRTDTGPIRRFADEDRGEDPARSFPGSDPEVARRLAGADTGSLRQGSENDRSSQSGRVSRADPDGPPLYEGATSASAIAGQEAGMGSAGESAGAGNAAGSPVMGSTGGRSGSAPGVASTTGAGISNMTGTNRTGGPAPGDENADVETAQPPRKGEH
jgi:hypothetical protein